MVTHYHLVTLRSTRLHTRSTMQSGVEEEERRKKKEREIVLEWLCSSYGRWRLVAGNNLRKCYLALEPPGTRDSAEALFLRCTQPCPVAAALGDSSAGNGGFAPGTGVGTTFFFWRGYKDLHAVPVQGYVEWFDVAFVRYIHAERHVQTLAFYTFDHCHQLAVLFR